VFHARSRDLVAKIEQLRVIVRGLARLLLDTLSKMLGDLRQRALFLANDAIEIGVGFSRGGYVGHRAGGVATKKTGLGAYHAPRVESTPEPLSGARRGAEKRVGNLANCAYDIGGLTRCGRKQQALCFSHSAADVMLASDAPPKRQREHVWKTRCAPWCSRHRASFCWKSECRPHGLATASC